jgi:hypothetical protein
VVAVEAFDGRVASPSSCSIVGFSLALVVVGESVLIIVDAPSEVCRECDNCFDSGDEFCMMCEVASVMALLFPRKV